MNFRSKFQAVEREYPEKPRYGLSDAYFHAFLVFNNGLEEVQRRKEIKIRKKKEGRGSENLLKSW